ncbi:MAG: hypothetical protein ACN6ON_07765 [Sphingobacterium sp.]
MKRKQLLFMAGAYMLVVPARAQEKDTAAPESTIQSKAGQTKAAPSAAVRNSDQPYRAALGIKFLWGISATGKFFLKDKAALETIAHYDRMGGLGTALSLTALYEYHGNFSVPGLRWYLGGETLPQFNNKYETFWIPWRNYSTNGIFRRLMLFFKLLSYINMALLTMPVAFNFKI